MRRVPGAISAAVRAPVRRWRLSLVLWLGRVLPVALAFGMPIFAKTRARLAHHPDAALLMDPSHDSSGFAYDWTADFFRDAMPHAADRLFWIIVFAWLLVTVLSAGIVARLVHGGGLFMAECGRYAGRFVRLALIVAFGMYCLDFGINTLLADVHTEAARLHHTQDFALEKAWVRGTLFTGVAYLLGLLHAYARIEMIAHERRSAVMALLRGLGLMVTRLPSLLIVESVMILLAAAGAGIAWVVLRGGAPGPDASVFSIAIFALAAAAASYLRSGIEVGALEARCRILAPEPSQTETPTADEENGGSGLRLATES